MSYSQVKTTHFKSVGTSLALRLLFFGGSESGGLCRHWFITELVEVAMKWGLTSWDDAKTHLTSFWWVESVHEESCQQVWEEVQLMQ
jgi:hypothetical protein